ncbi:hypothetical protein EC844_11058 [Acinetobacter calcoaceticus]|uniref:Uncharacterized protein n=1 Tax=Acinetobacter calcoaceticus TaxID=471 RepID=A0A4R1XRQ1_ACICA|nr:hypothetical protein EC844_11058 [Acinetobacter calcoaceticus]
MNTDMNTNINTKIAISLMLSLLCLGSPALAKHTDSQLNHAKFQQVCKGKTAGSPVSFANKGVLWNGSCQAQFIPTQDTAIKGDEKEISTICITDPQATSVEVNAKVVKGKCALAFTPPQPK